MFKKIIPYIFLLFTISACSEENTSPKPWGFHRIDLSGLKEGYQTFDNGNCPFTFEYPAFGEISRSQADSCWTDIAFPALNCKWHVSHHYITTHKNQVALFEDFRKLVFKHTKKASTIADTPIETPVAKGMKYELYGNIGTPVELFLHNDKHTMTVDFYYNTALHNDSLQPITDRMKKEIEHLVSTLKWKE